MAGAPMTMHPRSARRREPSAPRGPADIRRGVGHHPAAHLAVPLIVHLAVYLLVLATLTAWWSIMVVAGVAWYRWPVVPALAWGLVVAVHAVTAAVRLRSPTTVPSIAAGAPGTSNDDRGGR